MQSPQKTFFLNKKNIFLFFIIIYNLKKKQFF